VRWASASNSSTTDPADISATLQDPVEILQRIEQLLERVKRRDSYGELLARASVVVALSDIQDPDKWRADLRRQARADRIKIRTGINEKIAYAVLAAGADRGNDGLRGCFARGLIWVVSP